MTRAHLVPSFTAVALLLAAAPALSAPPASAPPPALSTPRAAVPPTSCTQTPEPARWQSAAGSEIGRADALVFAHRGGTTLAPENTLAAVRSAYAFGAEVVEIDLRTTADGVLVALHDSTVDRTTDGTGAVADLALAEVRALDAAAYAPWAGGEHAGEQVPTVEEVLELAASVGRGVEFDMKDVRDPAALADLAAAYGVLELSFFNTPDPRVLAAQPTARFIYNIGTEPAGVLYAAGRSYAEVFGSKLAEFTPEKIAEIHDACGLAVPHSYDRFTGDEAADISHGRRLGLDGFQVNAPDVAAATLGEPVPTRLRAEARQACLVNADNGLGLPGRTLTGPGRAAWTTDKAGCVTLTSGPPAGLLRFDGDAAALPAPRR